jgi:hypothetical protein
MRILIVYSGSNPEELHSIVYFYFYLFCGNGDDVDAFPKSELLTFYNSNRSTFQKLIVFSIT